MISTLPPGFPERSGFADRLQSIDRRLAALERSNVGPTPGEAVNEFALVTGAPARATVNTAGVTATIPVLEGFQRLSILAIAHFQPTAGTGGDFGCGVEIDLTPHGAPLEGGTVDTLGAGERGLTIATHALTVTEWPATEFTVNGIFSWTADPGAGTTVNADILVATAWYPTP